MTDHIDAAVASVRTCQFRLGLFNGRAAMLVLPEDTTDEELLYISGSLVTVVRPALAQKRIAARPRILLPQ